MFQVEQEQQKKPDKNQRTEANDVAPRINYAEMLREQNKAFQRNSGMAQIHAEPVQMKEESASTEVSADMEELQMKQAPAQMMVKEEDEEKSVQGKAVTTQLMAEEEEEPVQGKIIQKQEDEEEIQAKGMAVNDTRSLENEADVMGKQVAQKKGADDVNNDDATQNPAGGEGDLKGPNQPFVSEEAAAKDFGKTYNDNSIANKCEYASSIYLIPKKNPKEEQQYSYTIPRKGSIDGVKPSEPGSGFEVVSTIHTHGHFVPDKREVPMSMAALKYNVNDVYENERYTNSGVNGNNMFSFSKVKEKKNKEGETMYDTKGGDIGKYKKQGKNGWVVTPNGALMKYQCVEDENKKKDYVRVVDNQMPSDNRRVKGSKPINKLGYKENKNGEELSRNEPVYIGNSKKAVEDTVDYPETLEVIKFMKLLNKLAGYEESKK